MVIADYQVASNIQIAANTFLIGLESSLPLGSVLPGQFFNIKVSDGYFPLLRRPFSVSDISDNKLFFMYKVVGEGTKILSKKTIGDKLNLLGPLGNSFKIDENFDQAILIGGGIGIAPFPFLIKKLKNIKTSVLFGVRSKEEAHTYGLTNVHYASDDGSIGSKGTVVELLDTQIKDYENGKTKIFACGPNPMFRSLKKYLINKNIECEISMESSMACGFGICQGCPVQYKDDSSYNLICKDGPIFNINDVEI